MELIPAIDLMGGKVVRLHRGSYDDVTVFADDPVVLVMRYAKAGARRLHVVDLDGARSGEPGNVDSIARIVAASTIAVQIGGGIRDRASAERWLAAGAARVVLGTSAVQDPSLVEALCSDHPDRIVVALDARGEDVAIEGWTRESGQALLPMAQKAAAWGATAILYTDIDRDGTGEGPAIERTAALQKEVAIDVIASGGIGTREHLRALSRAGVRAAVCGRALLSGAIAIEDALAAAEAD